jgi:hypothetical protein
MLTHIPLERSLVSYYDSGAVVNLRKAKNPHKARPRRTTAHRRSISSS